MPILTPWLSTWLSNQDLGSVFERQELKFIFEILVGRPGIEPATPGLKDVDKLCCSILIDTKLEHPVKAPRRVLYLCVHLVISDASGLID